MFYILIFMLGVICISLIMLFMNFVLKKYEFIKREKNSSFECGFNSMISFRLPFSIQFFFMSILFLIFDVEMVLLFPLIKFMGFNVMFFWFLVSLIIFMILLLGLYIEWKNNFIEWFK